MLRRFLPCAAAGLALTLTGNAAHAVAGTDSLAGWTVTGDAVAAAGAITLTSAYFADGDPDTPFNLSGRAAADIAGVEAAAGVAAYALDLAAPDFGTEGSVVVQQFQASAGQQLSFTWTFGSGETLFEDHAFAVINGQVFTLATRSQPGNGPQTFGTLLAAGPVTLALGVIDTGDVLGVSTLTVSALQVSAVPEPAPALLLAGGLALLAWRRRGPAGARVRQDSPPHPVGTRR